MTVFSLVSIVGILLYLMGFIGLALFIIVLFKLNKVLDIWLERNRRY